MWCPPSATALASARRAGAPGEDGQAELKGTDMEHREHRAELVDVIRRIRHRWRLRLATRGAVVVFFGETWMQRSTDGQTFATGGSSFTDLALETP